MDIVRKGRKAIYEDDDDDVNSAVTAISDDDLLTSDESTEIEISELSEGAKEILVWHCDHQGILPDFVAQCLVHSISLTTNETSSGAESEETAMLLDELLDEYPTLGECSPMPVEQVEREIVMLEKSSAVAESSCLNDAKIQWVEDANEVMEFLEVLGISPSDETLPELSVEQIEMFLNE